MKAGYISAPFRAEFRTDLPEPQLKSPHDVKIQVKVCGICGSEVHAYHGMHAWRVPPLVSGHEFAGVVCEIGSGVTSCNVGDRVTAEPQIGCGECDLCKQGKYNLCKSKRILGATYWSGSFGEYVVVPEQCVIRLAANVSFDHGALIEPIAVGMHAVRANNINKNSSVAIIGCGTIGLGALISAKCYQPKLLLGIDVVDFNLQKASVMGADKCLNGKTDNVEETVMSLTNGIGVDTTFLTFGNEACLKQAAAITKPGGNIAEIAVMPDSVSPLGPIQIKELHLNGSNMYTRDDFQAVVDAIATGMINLSDFISKRFSIKDMAAAMEYVDKRKEPFVKVVFDF